MAISLLPEQVIGNLALLGGAEEPNEMFTLVQECMPNLSHMEESPVERTESIEIKPRSVREFAKRPDSSERGLYTIHKLLDYTNWCDLPNIHTRPQYRSRKGRKGVITEAGRTSVSKKQSMRNPIGSEAELGLAIGGQLHRKSPHITKESVVNDGRGHHSSTADQEPPASSPVHSTTRPMKLIGSCRRPPYPFVFQPPHSSPQCRPIRLKIVELESG
ncbi:hypothetical protein BJ508DRAFT_307212 [Ascobolus immersus RN42]|uniref:Uncharacterized protein n=1 Tax=Ascobolus immersus RN42 TaxID=1160509 RepID=A0A3N4I9H1_ASCIM|nr:hypothetical protein BJ508DRAFT_307212 [Ascobolus immersus RN42]